MRGAAVEELTYYLVEISPYVVVLHCHLTDGGFLLVPVVIPIAEVLCSTVRSDDMHVEKL